MGDQNKKRNTGWVYLLWPDLDLTPEQAQKIAHSDKRPRPFSPGGNFSQWENWDWEFYVFSSVLNPDQLTHYVCKRDQKIKEHEQSLVEDDNSTGKLNEIDRAFEKINYLETVFLPAISRKFHTYSVKDPLHTKYDFLKAEYKNYIDKKHREIVADHFRHSKAFQPNILKEKLLRHKIEAMYPEFSTFEKKMDDITKSVVQFLKCPPEIFDRDQKQLSSIFADLDAFTQKAWDDYIKSENPHFYAFSVSEDKRSQEERDNELYFSLLLIDRDYYGYK